MNLERQTNDIPYGFVTTGEAVIELNYRYSQKQINQLCDVGRVVFIPAEKSPIKKKLVRLNDVIKYASAHPKERYDAVWDAIKLPNSELTNIPKGERETFYILNGFDTKLMISSKCRVVDMTHGSVIKCHPHKDIHNNLTGYYDVSGLKKNGKTVTTKLHILVGLTQCDNALHKSILHHIKPININDMKISDHTADNLIYVWKHQHYYLHKLLKEGKEKEYKEMIKEIKKENKQKAYRIPHPDYTPNEKWNHWLYLDEKGYKKFKKSGNIPYTSILIETAEQKTEGKI